VTVASSEPRPDAPGPHDRWTLLAANLVLFAYVLDAGLSLVDGLWLRPAGVFALAPLRELVAAGMVWIALAWLVTGWDRPRLPTWLFFLPALSVLWLNWASGVPLPFLVDPWAPGALISVLTWTQVAIAALMLAGVRRRWGRWWVPTTALGPRRPGAGPVLGRLLRHGGALALAAVLLAPLALLEQLQRASGAWLAFRPDGMHLADAAFEDAAGRRVRLVAMAHVGERGGYERIFETFRRPGALVLEEGVSDREGRIGPPLASDARRWILPPREAHRLMAQPAVEQFVPARRADVPDATPDEDSVVLFRADVDASDLSEETLAYVRWGEGVLGDGLRGGSWLALLGGGPGVDPERFFAEVVDRRNAVLLDHLDRALERFDEVVVPWGAMHMPGLAAALHGRGFRMDEGSIRRHRLVSWAARPPPSLTAENRTELRRFDEDAYRGWLEQELARRYAEARESWVFGPAEDGDDVVPGSWFGGLPTRFEGEDWPRNPETGRPLTFVAELTRDADNAAFLGAIERLRVFLDYDAFFGGDEAAAYEIRVTRRDAPRRRIVSWSERELAALEADFGESEYGAVFRAPRQPVAMELRRTVSIGFLEAPIRLSLPEVRAWHDVAFALEASWAEAHPDVLEPYERSVLGGRPAWVQGEETAPLPFFLQLYPDGPLMWGDMGHLYLFLDPERPEAGMLLRGQMG
jgi:hypothetical protein